MEYFFQAKSCLMNHVPALFDPYVKKKACSYCPWMKLNLACLTALESGDNSWDWSINAKLWTAAIAVFVCGGGLYHHDGKVLLSGFEISSVAQAGHTRQSVPRSRALVKTQTWEKTRGSCVRLFFFFFFLNVGLMQYWCYWLGNSCFTEQHWILLLNNWGQLSWAIFLFFLPWTKVINK